MKTFLTMAIVFTVVFLACVKANITRITPATNLGLSENACCCTDTAGIYTPVFQPLENAAGPFTSNDSIHFIMVKNQVTVWGSVEVRGIASANYTSTQFNFTLPIPSNLKNGDLVGTCVVFQNFTGTVNTENPAYAGFISGDSFADKARIFFFAQKNFYARVFYQFTYTKK